MSLNRKVGTESSKSYERRLVSQYGSDYEHYVPSFFDLYMEGNGLDIGFAGYTPDVLPILPGAIGVDINYPGYDGKTLPFENNSQDYVYSSHCLEHIDDYITSIREWYRVVKVGGHIVTVVPHKYLYEKKESLPSIWNPDHKRFYTPASLLHEFEQALEPNSYRVKFLEDGGEGFNYNIKATDHSTGEYEITLVIQKIEKPSWDLIKSPINGKNDVG